MSDHESDLSVSLSAQAYCKLILHSIRYQHDPVCGILLARVPSGNDTALPLEIVDAIPFFHTASSANLSPPLMIALTLVEAHCLEKRDSSGESICIGGYYFANELLHDDSIPPSAQRVADRIAEQLPSACLVMIKNDMLKPDIIVPPLRIFQRSSLNSSRLSSSWHPLSDSKKAVSGKARTILRKLSADNELVASLVDLDSHLDSRPPTGAEDSSQAAGRAGSGASEENGHIDEANMLGDWRNPAISLAVEQAVEQLRLKAEPDSSADGETESDVESTPICTQ